MCKMMVYAWQRRNGSRFTFLFIFYQCPFLLAVCSTVHVKPSRLYFKLDRVISIVCMCVCACVLHAWPSAILCVVMSCGGYAIQIAKGYKWWQPNSRLSLDCTVFNGAKVLLFVFRYILIFSLCYCCCCCWAFESL